MPEVSRFYGIVIAMYHNEHSPPHFHVRYAGRKAIVNIDPVYVLRGDLPPRATSLVTEWANLHKAELLDNWNRTRNMKPPKRIEPLE